MASSDSELRNVERLTLAVAPVFSWSVGNYMERFFDELRAGKFMGVKCPDCGRVYLPPRMVCERCFTKIEDWVDLPDTGTIETFTVGSVRVGEDGELLDLDDPEIIGMVKHDGADTGLVARVTGLDPEEVEAGLKVRAVLDTDAENVLDLLSHYQPVK